VTQTGREGALKRGTSRREKISILGAQNGSEGQLKIIVGSLFLIVGCGPWMEKNGSRRDRSVEKSGAGQGKA